MAEEKKTEIVKRGRGGTVGKGTRPKRSEQMKVQTEEGENRKYLAHSMRMFDWEQPDMRNPAEVRERIGQYFGICTEDDMKPSVSGMALAFGVNRKTLWAWVNGVDCKYLSEETRNLIKKAYEILTTQMENYMQNGKINPVAGIFLMKNNMDYRDQQEVTLTPGNPLGNETSPEELQKKYIEATGIATDSDD